MKTVPMVDMKRTPEEKVEAIKEMVIPSPSEYPYGLCISLCSDELDKLGLEDDDLVIGGMIHLHCMATITSVSTNSNDSGDDCRVELQITHIAAEDEDDENEENRVTPAKKLSKLYK